MSSKNKFQSNAPIPFQVKTFVTEWPYYAHVEGFWCARRQDWLDTACLQLYNVELIKLQQNAFPYTHICAKYTCTYIREAEHNDQWRSSLLIKKCTENNINSLKCAKQSNADGWNTLTRWWENIYSLLNAPHIYTAHIRWMQSLLLDMKRTLDGIFNY